MATLLSQPGTGNNPARLGEPVTLRSDTPAIFGLTPGKVELLCAGQPILIPPSDVTWDPNQIVATLPTVVPRLEGPFAMRVTPAAPAIGILETSLVALPDVKTALDQVVGRLRLLADLGDGKGPIGKDEIEVGPENLGDLTFVVAAPTTVIRRAPKALPRPRRPLPPIVSAPSTGALKLEGLPPIVAEALAGANVKAEVRLVVSGLDGTLKPEEVDLKPRTDVLGLELTAAPYFVELGSGEQLDRLITVQARINVQATPPGGSPISAAEVSVPDPPMILRLEPVEIPTMLILFRNRNYARTSGDAEGFALVVVPTNSPLARTTEPITGPQGVGTLLNAAPLDPAGPLMEALKRLPALGPVVARVAALITMLRAQDHFVLCRSPIDNLNEVTMIERAGVKNDTEAENQVSSLLLFGRPGTKASLYCRRHRQLGDGKLVVELKSDDAPVPVALAALPTLPETPVPSFDALGDVNLPSSAAGQGVGVTVEEKCTIKDKGTGRTVFADTFKSVELVIPPKTN